MKNNPIVSNSILGFVSKVFFRTLNDLKPEKVLIYHVGNIGDIIVTTPVYRSIRNAFPEAKITLLTSPGKKGLPGAQEIIPPLNLVNDLRVYYPEEITTLKKVISFFKGIKREHHDFLIYLPANQWGFWHLLRDMIFFFLSGISCAIGFRTYEGYYHYRKGHQMPLSEVERLKELIEPLNTAPSELTLEFPVGSEDKSFIPELFQRYNIEEGRLKVVVHPGGKKPSKLWPQKYFALLIDRLIEEVGVQVILVGSNDEVEMMDEIIKRIKHKVANLAGKLSLSQLAAVIEKADLIISNDSGPMHIATAVKTPVIAIFSGVDIPYLWYPCGNIHRVLRKNVDCSPCFKSECDDHLCIQGIGVDDVFQVVKSTMEQKR